MSASEEGQAMRASFDGGDMSGSQPWDGYLIYVIKRLRESQRRGGRVVARLSIAEKSH